MRGKKRLFQFWAAALLILVLGGFLLYQIRTQGTKSSVVYQISIIIEDSSYDNKESLRQGLEQASRDFRVEVTYVYLTTSKSVEDQVEMINREAADEADAILVIALNDERVRKALEDANANIPVITLDSAPEDISSLIQHISCDNELLGRSLGEAIILDGGAEQTVALIKDGTLNGGVIKRYESLSQILQNNGINVEEWDLTNTTNKESYLERLWSAGAADLVVAFDADTLEMAAEIKSGFSDMTLTGSTLLYGFGSNTHILEYMEQGEINCIGLASEYIYGYLGVKAAVNQIKGKSYTTDDPGCYIIHPEDMFTEENQRVLFPFS